MKRPDCNYHQNKLELLIRDLRDHTADELARVLMRLAMVSDSEVVKEKEFTNEMQQRIQELENQLQISSARESSISYRKGFKTGVDYANRKSKGEKGLENPFEPDYVEYEAYWDGFHYAIEESK